MSRQKKYFYVKLNTDQGSHDKKNMAVNELAKRLGMNRRYVNQVVTGSVMCSDTIFFSENLEE